MSGSSMFDERYWPCFLLVMLLLSTLLCSHTQPSHVRQLEKRDPVYQGHCQWDASSKNSDNKMSLVQIWARVDGATQCGKNFVTPRWTTKIPKISTPLKYPAIQYVHGVSSMFLLISEPPVCHTFSASPKQIARDCVKPCKDGWKLVISDRLSTVKYRGRLKLLHIEYKDLLYCWQLAVQFLWVLWLSCDSHLLWVQWLSVQGKAAVCPSTQ